MPLDRPHYSDEVLRANNLQGLRNGDQIEVEFRDVGWVPAIFRGFTDGGWSVRFESNGVRRITAARYARKVIT